MILISKVDFKIDALSEGFGVPVRFQGGSGRDATMITTFKQKVEELRAKPPDSEKAEHTTTPPSSKKVCGHYEKQMQNMPAGNLELVKD